ncbi:hypothetical protein ACN28S_47495 [Cystobacter fuscus]
MKRVSLPPALLLLVFLASCGTGAQRRTFPVEMTLQPMTGPNERGWTVTPEALHVSVGPVRFYEGHVLLSRRAPRFDPFLLLGGTAWAHPGHYLPGDAMAEVLSTTVVDLLAASPTVLGEANAVTGDYGSMELTLPVPREATRCACAARRRTRMDGGCASTWPWTCPSPSRASASSGRWPRRWAGCASRST